ncbi:MAG: hypothetical protein JO339_41785 [Alphaproteobacteria bacterium]|nr:hypothetical protein [Alphaproteobacteria bacterium]
MPAFVRHITRMATAILILSIAASTACLARADADSEDEITYPFSFWDLKEGAKFGRYYDMQARISAESAGEPERILANGVRWRLLVDEKTGMRMPHITWMPNRQSMVAANRFLEMAHGAAIAEGDVFNRMWVHENTARALRGLPPYLPLRLQSDIELTYASSAFVSYIDLGHEETSEKHFSWRGGVRVFDIKRGSSYEFGLCPARYGYNGHGERFTIPINSTPPFAVCDDAAFDALDAVVKRWASAAIPAKEHDHQPVDGCNRAAHQLARWGLPAWYYLTPVGLAFVLDDAWPVGRPTNCRLSAGDPVVIPYPALRRFIRHGPLGDELLKLD